MTCYDLRFPELALTLALNGAEVLVLPTAWVKGPLKEHHWATLLAAALWIRPAISWRQANAAREYWPEPHYRPAGDDDGGSRDGRR
jgi:predicted amidohydrolase